MEGGGAGGRRARVRARERAGSPMCRPKGHMTAGARARRCRIAGSRAPKRRAYSLECSAKAIGGAEPVCARLPPESRPSKDSPESTGTSPNFAAPSSTKVMFGSLDIVCECQEGWLVCEGGGGLLCAKAAAESSRECLGGESSRKAIESVAKQLGNGGKMCSYQCINRKGEMDGRRQKTKLTPRGPEEGPGGHAAAGGGQSAPALGLQLCQSLSFSFSDAYNRFISGGGRAAGGDGRGPAAAVWVCCS
jgi:hypothetical protein